MKLIHKLGITSFVVGFYVGCSPVSFDKDASRCAGTNANCVVENGKYRLDYSVTAGFGKVDILIVDDNSASMSFEQKRLAARFQNFIQDLDARQIDYRIGITTTDVGGSPFPQGGSLVSFDQNVSYLTPQVANRITLFNSTLNRPETTQCENFIADWFRTRPVSSQSTSEYASQYAANCPSGDERGVLSANRVVLNNPNSFIRPDAHLAVIFLSDEDERSGLYGSGQGFTLEADDQPATLISNIKSKYGNDKYNSLSIHSIVVKDSTCLAQQNSQTLGNPENSVTQGMVKGSIGQVYLTFAQNGWGRSADICSSDYTNQLGQIRSVITDRIKDVLLACANPGDLTVTVGGSSVRYQLSGKTLTLSSTVSPGSTLKLSYTCDQL